MMFADMLIEFVYLIMRILYNIVKYTTIALIRLVKCIKRQYVRRRYKKQVQKGNFNIEKDKNGKYVLWIGGNENE